MDEFKIQKVRFKEDTDGIVAVNFGPVHAMNIAQYNGKWIGIYKVPKRQPVFVDLREFMESLFFTLMMKEQSRNANSTGSGFRREYP